MSRSASLHRATSRITEGEGTADQRQLRTAHRWGRPRRCPCRRTADFGAAARRAPIAGTAVAGTVGPDPASGAVDPDPDPGAVDAGTAHAART